MSLTSFPLQAQVGWLRLVLACKDSDGSLKVTKTENGVNRFALGKQRFGICLGTFLLHRFPQQTPSLFDEFLIILLTGKTLPAGCNSGRGISIFCGLLGVFLTGLLFSQFKGFTTKTAQRAFWQLSLQPELAPIYYNLLTHVPPFELLAHRTLWSFIFFALVLMYQNRLVEVCRLSFVSMRLRQVYASFLIALNWYFFIHSVQTGQATEAALIFHDAVGIGFLGALIFRENLSIGQWLAVGLAALAVIVLTYDWAPPWIALTLSTSFSFYGVIKNASPPDLRSR